MSEERIKLIEKLGEVVQKIVNPPTHSERYQQLSEAVEILSKINSIAKDVALQDLALKSIITSIEDLNEKVKTTQAFIIVTACLALIAIIINIIM